jgi:glycosyltransferase involved in cell wall biosynthesis
VSILILRTDGEEQGLREKLDRRVALYHLGMVEEAGRDDFLSSMSVDIIHSHNLLAEQLFFANEEPLTVPYLVTLHGSYESATLDEALMRRIVRGVDHWVYLTERNLEFLKPQAINQQKISKIANAVELKENAPLFTREDLGIPDDAFVFAVLSRAIKEKGWEQTALAFESASAKQDREMHLIFCGIGPEAEQLAERFASANIHFLGFQSDPHAVYRISDCAVLASRFGGESYPLTIIEALQVCRPVICTDVGECRTMIGGPDGAAGIVIEALPDDQAFIAQLEDAMRTLAKKEHYAELKVRATALSKHFDHEDMLDAYLALYTAMQRE